MGYEKVVEKGEGKYMIGARIKEYLAENGIKQSYLAEKTGLTTTQISNICIHDRKIDALEYYKICQALNVPLETFMPKEEEE